MIRIDVDFNARDERGHVVARLPADQLSHLSLGEHVYLYDPVDRLWGEATVQALEPEISVGIFDVDWDSFVDGELSVEGIAGDLVWITDASTTTGTKWIFSSRTANGPGAVALKESRT